MWFKVLITIGLSGSSGLVSDKTKIINPVETMNQAWPMAARIIQFTDRLWTIGEHLHYRLKKVGISWGLNAYYQPTVLCLCYSIYKTVLKFACFSVHYSQGWLAYFVSVKMVWKILRSGDVQGLAKTYMYLNAWKSGKVCCPHKNCSSLEASVVYFREVEPSLSNSTFSRLCTCMWWWRNEVRKKCA